MTHTFASNTEFPRKIRIAVLALHPVQYHTPLYKRICECPRFDAKVLYLDTVGLKGVYDSEFQVTIEWDLPLLEGHDHEFLRNWSPNNRGGFLSRLNLGLLTEISKARFDVVLIQGYSVAACWIALFAARMYGVKVIWRGEVTLKASDRSRTLRNALRQWLVRTFLRRCDALLYTCEGNRRFLLRYATPSAPLHAFLCSVDNAHFRREYGNYLPERRRARAELGIPDGNMVVLFCGRLTSRKRPLDIVDGIRKAGSVGISLVIVGDGPMRDELLGRASSADVHAIHIGFVNQSKIGRYYSIADVFCLPSEYDPSPKSLNEAMNFLLVPLVSDAIGTCADLILDGETGYTFPRGDTDTMALHLSRLKHDPALRHRIATQARDRVERFTYEANVAGLEAAAQQALVGTTLTPGSGRAH